MIENKEFIRTIGTRKGSDLFNEIVEISITEIISSSIDAKFAS
jgi:hypothetical protein